MDAVKSCATMFTERFKPGGKFMANTYQGQFPVKDTGEDGFRGTSPVGSFPANGYGLYDMAGNVWQWCSDWYRADSNIEAASKNVCRDPRGSAESYDPGDPYSPKRVVKGGSFLCNPDYCEKLSPECASRDAPRHRFVPYRFPVCDLRRQRPSCPSS